MIPFDVADAMEQKIVSQRKTIWILVILFVLVLLFLLFRNFLLSDEIGRLQLSEQTLSAEISDLKDRLAGVKKRNAELVRGRIPDLRNLKFGELVKRPANFVESLLFTQTRSFDGDNHEYMLVLKNNTERTVLPQVKIKFFDASGFQVGGVVVNSADTVLTRNKARLKPGESRSFTGKLEFDFEKVPPYFIVRTLLDDELSY